jgi:ATP-binding cassette subfamily F protein 3
MFHRFLGIHHFHGIIQAVQLLVKPTPTGEVDYLLLQCRELHKNIGTDEIVRNISFILEEREKCALIGVNGAGKTSVFRLLTGEWRPDGGEIMLATGARVGYLPQLTQLESDAALYDELASVFAAVQRMESEIRAMEQEMGTLAGAALAQAMERYARLTAAYEEQRGYETDSRVRGVLKGLGFVEAEWKRPVSQFSGGQQTRAALGKLLLTAPDLLLLDEPTNHLDIESVAWLEDYLRGFRSAMLVVSHDRYFLDRIVTKTIEIEHKKSFVYNGNYTFFANNKAKNREVSLRHDLQQQKEIKHHEEVIKTLRSYKTERAIIRAKSREKLLNKIERLDKPDSLPDKMRLMLTPKLQSGNDVLAVEHLSMAFDEKTLFSDISFELKRGEKAALIGPNGIGKTTLFKILMGEIPPVTGKIREGVNVRRGYYDQAQQQLSEDKTIFQELADTYPKLTQSEIRNVLAAFIFTGDDVFKPVAALSGGERGRVSLAKIMLNGANFLILDEPTNHLDMFSKEILEEALRDFPGTVLYISHDRYFINNTATRILELGPGGLMEYRGNYDYYTNKKKALLTESQENPGNAQTDLPLASRDLSLEAGRFKSEPSGSDLKLLAHATGQKAEWMRKREAEAEARRIKNMLTRLETDIACAEKLLGECNSRLADDATARDAQAAAAAYAEKTALEQRLETLYADWDIAQTQANDAGLA